MDGESQHGDSQHGEGADGPPGVLMRACDQCRVRKIRCDKESPCSNCRIAQRRCSSTGLGQKPKEARQRVLISTQYERKIDQIEDRLGNIESLLRSALASSSGDTGLRTVTDGLLRQDLAGGGSMTTAATIITTARTTTPSVTSGDTATGAAAAAAAANSASATTAAYDRDQVDDHDLDSTFEGESSLAAHTVFASEFLEHAVGRSSSLRGTPLSPNMEAALSSLQQIAVMQHRRSSSHTVRFAHLKPVPRGGLRKLPMPPLQVVVALLREIKETPPLAFTLTCFFMAIENFTDYCRRVYFATEDFSPATFIIVNAGLFYLFQEKVMEAETAALGSEYQRYCDMCRDNMETSLANLNLLLPAKIENIEALLLGSSYAIEIGKPSLAWPLNCVATQMCQTLGYHRASTLGGSGEGGARGAENSTDTRPLIFWFAYILDKGLALRLGRASTIQDYDVTLTRDPTIRGSEAWSAILRLWIRHSGVQGRIYEQLYSPGALGRPFEEEARLACARSLAEELDVIARDTRRIWHGIVADPESPPMLTMLLKSDEVSLLASLTLVYRALPSEPGHPSTFSPKCVEVARRTMQTHHECMVALQTSDTLRVAYVHWTILYAPFIPFIVLFCHVIESSDADDLRRLSDFVGSMQSVCDASEAAAKLHRLCQVLYNVAFLYTEAKTAQQQAQQQDGADQPMGSAPPVFGSEFDQYLSALGFMPVEDALAGQVGGGGGGMESDLPPGVLSQTAQLGDWFSGNRYMMGLLEEDLTNFNGNGWGNGP